jgi:Flp pilus assembly protein TadG
MMNAWKKFRRTLSAFRVANAGNVAITFAFASLPIIGFVGAAVDYSRANSVKAAMQTALDSTALMLAKEASTDTEDELKINASKFFKALFKREEAKDVDVKVTYTTTGGSNIKVEATASLDAQFVRVLGFDTFHLGASSTAKWGINRLRVALVLDNTGSMADAGKMAALKTATKGLIAQLQGAVTTTGDVYVSIVPFVKDVNVGAANYTADWIYWGTAAQDPTFSDNASWDAINGTCSNTSWTSRSNCFSRGGTCSNTSFTRQSTCTTNGTCSVGGQTSQSTCNSSGTCSISGNNSQTSCNSAGTCSLAGYSTQTSCQNAGTCSISGQSSQSSCQNAHVCSVGTWGSKSTCQSHGGTWLAGVWTPTPGTWTTATWTPATFTPFVWTPGVWTPKNHNTWTGCVMDRGYPASPSNLGGLSGPDATYNYDTNALAPDPVTPRWSSLYPAEQYSACPQAVKNLSDDWSGMNTLVDNMSPNGNTNQAIGLQLGWTSLVGGGPFTVPAMDPNYKYNQVIILLTDGLNTQNRWYSADTDIDPRQATTCDNIKDAKIDLYTIQVNTGGDPTSTMLQNCASDPEKFYLLTQADQMTATFQTIGTNLTKLRVAQ